jgi:hypothetical protein
LTKRALKTYESPIFSGKNYDELKVQNCIKKMTSKFEYKYWRRKYKIGAKKKI